MKRTAILGGMLPFIAASILMGLPTQSPIKAPVVPAFEAATVKPNDGKSGGIAMGNYPGGLFRATNVSLRMLLKQAYRIEDFQIYGAPDWIDAARFDIVAEAGSGASPEQMDVMLQSLLEDRFRLRFHRNEKELALYALTVAKNGPKLEAVNDGLPLPNGNRRGPAAIGKGQLTMQRTPISQLAAMLATQLGRPVLDQTGLSGVFNVKLAWSPESLAGEVAGTDPDPSHPSIFTAIQEQLGLRLESQKGAIEAFVIDGAEKPPQN